jgi:flagellar biosynthesis/type III secretory pathway protein FliH
MDGAEQRPAHWIADAQVKSGGCVVEGRDRIVDGRVDTALERVYRRLAHQNA